MGVTITRAGLHSPCRVSIRHQTSDNINRHTRLNFNRHTREGGYPFRYSLPMFESYSRAGARSYTIMF